MQQGTKTAGHPVNVATGTVYSTHEDISIPGKVDLVWERRYSTALLDKSPSPLGPGWTTRYFAALTKAEGEFQFLAPEGEVEIFADPGNTVERGGVVRNLGTFQELAKRKNEYVVTRWDVETGEIERYVFKEGRKGEAWPLASIEDVTGQGLDMLRDKAGRLTGIQQRLEKRTLIIDYTNGNRISFVSFLMPGNKRQVLARYEYDKNGRLSAAYNALNYADRYEYDANGRMTREIVKDGGVFSFRYDDRGRCIKTSGLDRYDEKTFRYLDFGWTEVTNSLGHVTRYQWLPSGQVVCEINPLGAKWQTEYDEHGRIVMKFDPNGAVTKYEYDEQGNRCKTINALTHEFLLTFNNNHLPLTLKDPSGNVWKRAYDASNRLSATEDPLGARWTFAYDSYGNLIRVIDPNGACKRQVFSQSGILQEVTDWEGHPTRYTIDLFGRVVERIDPLGNITHFQYDLLGNPREIAFADGPRITCEYDSGGNLNELTDGNGHTVKFRYGSCGRVLEKMDPLGGLVRYKWGSEPGHLEGIINEKGEVYSFVCDEDGRVVREKGFDGRELEFVYDLVGSCVTTINGAGERVLYSRDQVGRVIKATLPDGTIATFEYDVHGNLTLAENPNCKVTYERDPLGRAVREIQGNYVVESRYDAAGNLVETRTNLGHEVTYGVDGNGLLLRLITKNRGSMEFKRNARGDEITRLLAGGTRLDQKYDAIGQLIEQHVSMPKDDFSVLGGLNSGGSSMMPSGNTIVDRTYQYNKAGALASIEDGWRGKTIYDYDPLERLIQAIREKGVSEHFAYDYTGNITSIRDEGIGEEVLEYGPGNRLIQKGNTRYFYDDNGRLIKRIENSESPNPKEWRYTWDARDQLASVKTPDGFIWKYTYDALGRRILKEGPGKVIRFVWDRDVIVHQIENETTESTWIFAQDTFEPLCKLQDESIYSVISDHLGTPCELVDLEGNIVWSASYKSWGEVEEARVRKVECPIRFQGQWFDEESGLSYNRFRYYDSAIGRFLSADPIGMLGGINLYSYCPNPINWVDPFGLVSCKNGRPGRRAAFRRAKRDAGIPMGQQPAQVRRVPMTDRNGHVILDSRGRPTMTREYVFTRPDNSQVIIQDHSAGHRFGQGGVGDQGPHFNVRPPENTRTGRVPGTSEHYPF
jgi:RHS repeat-associated protein